MLNVISTCRDILCVDINVDKRCVDHSSNDNPHSCFSILKKGKGQSQPVPQVEQLSTQVQYGKLASHNIANLLHVLEYHQSNQ